MAGQVPVSLSGVPLWDGVGGDDAAGTRIGEGRSPMAVPIKERNDQCSDFVQP